MNNNNTSLEICINNSSYDQSVYISNIIWRVSGLLCILIGIPGHILQIIIFSNNTQRKEPTSLYLFAIAICELIFLIGVFWLWCASMSLVKTDPREVLSCGIFYSILIGSTTLSNLYLALMSIDRSMIILCPTRYRLIVTQSHVILRIILICVLIILLLIPHHFYLYYNRKTTLFLCEFDSSVHPRRIRVWSFMHAILLVGIPSLIVCVCSFILLHNRCEHKRNYKKTLSVTARRMHRNSIFIFFVSLGILISLLPACILEIYIVHDRLFRHEMYCSIRWKVYKILLTWFLTLSSINYSVKFYIHLIISTSFRKSFIQSITCQSSQKPLGLPRVNNEQHSLQSLDHNKSNIVEI